MVGELYTHLHDQFDSIYLVESIQDKKGQIVVCFDIKDYQDKYVFCVKNLKKLDSNSEQE